MRSTPANTRARLPLLPLVLMACMHPVVIRAYQARLVIAPTSPKWSPRRSKTLWLWRSRSITCRCPCEHGLTVLPRLLQLSKSGVGDAAGSVSLPSRAQPDPGLLECSVEQLHHVRLTSINARQVCTCSFRGGLPGSFLIGKPPLAKSRWRTRFTVRFSLVREASPTHGETVRIMLDNLHLQPSVLLECNPTTF